MKNFLPILIFSIIIFISGCFNGSGDSDYFEIKRKAQQQYDLNMAINAKALINSFLKDGLTIYDGFDKINSGFYCMWKTRNAEIAPYPGLNKIFEENGYKVTLSKDRLRYIIVSETKSHAVGKYSNGANAVRIETIISVIDLKESKAYRLVSNMGGDPPSSTRNRNGDIGSTWSEKDIYDNIKVRIIK
jgi:hypothetical protein